LRLGFVSGSGGIMKPWAWSKRGKLGALGGVAVVLAAVGGIVAFALGPGGAENRVRVSGPSGSVPCGVSVPVSVYLDDLEARPSPNTPGVNYGLGAFAVWVSYDADILRVQSRSDVILNPELDQMDPDGDGVFPSFGRFGPYIDNYSGTVGYAAGSLVIDPSTNLPEEGPDPLWAQRPIQLFQVQFLTNNAGISPVTISRVELGDPGTQAYEPVTITNTSVTVTGGTCPNLPRPTPTPTPPVTPTRTPTPAPTPTPTPEGLGRGSEPVTPVPASEGGRPDCPAGWYVYNDPDRRFSICYPPGWDAIPVTTPEQTTHVQLSTALEKSATQLPIDYVSIAINVLLAGSKVDTSCEKAAADWGGAWAEAGVLALSGVEASTCQGAGPTELWGYGPLQAVVPIGADGTSLLIFAYKTGPDVSAGAALIEQVLRTLAPGPGRQVSD